jgi:hypothetical protein
MIGYIILIIIIGIIVSIITEQMLIRRLKLEEGVTISKGKCVLKPGYGLLPTQPSGSEHFRNQAQDQNQNQNQNQDQNQPVPDGRDFSGIGRNNLTDNNLSKFYKPYLGK